MEFFWKEGLLMQKIEQLDPNFRVNQDVPAEYTFFDPRQMPFQLYGLAPNEEGTYCRLPLDFLPQCSEGVRALSWHLTGACVRFSTDSAGLCVLWQLRQEGNMPHFTACGQSGLELFEEFDGGTRQIKNFIPRMAEGKGCQKKQSGFTALPGGMRHYALYFPLYNGLEELMLGFAPGAVIEPGRTPKIAAPLVFYGSSITQGGCASKVGSCYPSILARRLDAALVNLGFSGNARGEESIARYIAGLKMSVFIFDYDHNAPTPAHLAATHEPFFRIVRRAQPDLPVIFVSRPDYDKNPEDAKERRDVILRTYAHAIAEGDKKVYFVDGQQLYGPRDRDMCSVDGTHPNDIGFLRMADGLEPVLRAALGQ